MLHFSLT
ncbi:unnamed protein product, partial [Allacma fusca]